MADGYVCGICERKLKSNSVCIECKLCCTWVHKGCSGLTDNEFDEYLKKAKRGVKNQWICSGCKKIEVSRRSIGAGNISGLAAVNPMEVMSNGSCHSDINRQPRQSGRSVSSVKQLSTSDVSSFGQLSTSDMSSVPRSELNNIEENLNELVEKDSVTTKDLLKIILNVVNLIKEQNDLIHQCIAEKQTISELDKRISLIEKDVEEKRQANITSVKTREELIETNDLIYDEMQERMNRAKNIIIYNIPENKSNDVKVRIAHDFDKAKEVIKLIDSNGPEDFKVTRIGKPGNTPRPVRVIMKDRQQAIGCLKGKRKLTDASFSISADLTQAQRAKLRKVKEELKNKVESGDTNYTIRYIRDVPTLVKKKPISNMSNNHRNSISKNN